MEKGKNSQPAWVGWARLAALTAASIILLVALRITPGAQSVASAYCVTSCTPSGGCQYGGNTLSWTCLDCSFGSYGCCNDPGYISQSMGSCTGCGYDCAYYDEVNMVYADDSYNCSPC